MGIAASMGSWSARHRWAAAGGWLLFVVLAVFVGQSAGRVDVDEDRSMPGEVSQAATINDDAGLKPPAGEMVLVQAKGAGSATDPGFRTVVGEVMTAVKSTGKVTAVTSPYDTKSISADGRSALVRFDVVGDQKTAADRIDPVLDQVKQVQAKHPDLRVEEFGDASAEKVLNDAFGSDFKTAEFSAVPLALGILLIAFGALVAALLPVALAMTAFVAAGGVVALVSHLVPMSDTANSVMLLVGLAVGVDYCLFYLRREREERAAGHDADTSLRIAAATSGRAVLISGITVIVAMAGMLFTGIGDFKAMGVATMIVVAIAMFGSVTVLPALLSLLGHRVEKGRLPFLNRRRKQAAGRPAAPGNSRLWRTVLGPVLRHPKAATVIAGGALLALALPAFGMKTANLSMQQELGDSLPIIQTYEHIDTAFPGGPDQAHVVVKAADIDSPAVKQAIADFRAEAVSSGASKGPVTVTVHSAQNVARIDVPLEGGSDRARAEADVKLLRDHVRPDTLGKVAGLQAPVTGETAGSMDFTHKITSSVPPVFAFVTVFAFLLMLLSFRSLTIAVTSIVLNLLSVGAAYGILTAVFQHGWGASLVGAHGTGAVVAWLPLFLFVILFGLSMDYHVFVVSRIREARMRGLSTKGAIEHGITTTAGVVTSAAVIMVAVFAIFGTLSMQSMKQMGVGLAFAVLIDATVIRGVLLPAVMTLLGDRNWYLPRWMHRLPDLTHDESALPQPPAAAPHPAQQLPDRV
ncbi:MMPL family transporter [Streptomyces cocklensis]|uniref:SSD domain-containing protein n=1 Tax=Actinacidiphila cocklensis TaxID=887465 RepID=A0A9W4GUA5_9ACTN|nr:MMPL family transporter [Actinacidiphila cocklensis]MDD1059462.1 MMPL family transporter [Actinacidiphila cocklensis]CAG6397331.1 SSD domain-containing protein [Actinacidiphila cocklensis]